MRSFSTGDVSSPLEMCIPVLTSTSPAGDAASPKCGICDTAVFLTRNHFDAKSNSSSYEKNDRFDFCE
jgi:hypothetical protein